MTILGIESSCDECAAAVVIDGKEILSNVVATQIPFHAIYDGVVPEIASRKHTEWISQVVEEALGKAGIHPSRVDGVAATAKPGLLGSLLVGLSFAKPAPLCGYYFGENSSYHACKKLQDEFPFMLRARERAECSRLSFFGTPCFRRTYHYL